MSLTVHLSHLLALLVAGLAQGIEGSLRGQDPGPQPLELKEVFTLFQIRYNRSYSHPAEHARRLDIFARNLAKAQQLQEEDLGTAEFGVTPFSDLTEEEFGQLYGHQRVAGEAPSVSQKVGSEEWGQSVPPTCDWRKEAGIISSIRNQQNCNCCWAMAAAGNIEALWAIKYHQSLEVSVQELLDCDRCGNGCKGGFVWDAFLTVLNNSGLASDKDYPFKGNSKPHRCLAKKHKKVAWIQDFIMLQPCEQSIARYLATQGPITVTINMKLLQQYQKGVIKATPTTCDPQLVDHSVLLVGFGKSKSAEGRQAEAVSSWSHPHPRYSIPYWILKNSWGANWGEEGYFRLHRGSNTCGITKYPFTARLDKPVKKHQVSCPP
ncbi:cathepsin W isoform X4 [Physeter macrocephalus]|uniref:Cathepsin W n=1 Tax=Physeter macrocephalus TaxID=9755 RepID=A0A2Y9FSK8_PHYMC|nr:cathepsin W isoform X4 [Physeter catodon]|eukprot:XP_007128268.1 cathepsin W isoform X4 [Physeter catodon]